MTRAFLWRDGTMVDLGTRIGDVASEARDINDAGVVDEKSRETVIDFQNDRAVMWVPAR